ncbi:MAG: hypothetical protein DME03_20055 [Candidatus Rokuibacteriota bacterium]|nr:MAG: hypothetical protein DME03_20055 [Candidatus Rokubacteria bacterium]
MTTYAWWEDDLLKSVAYPNGTLHDRSDPRAYDRANRILAIVNRPAEIGGVPFSTYRYTYDRNGNRLSQVETQRSLTDGGAETTSYVYDNLDRLIGVTYATTQIVDNIDASRTVTFDYDRNLNQVSKIRGGTRTEFHFGIRDELLAVADGGGTATRFDYDQGKVRVKKIDAAGQETRYLNEGSSVVLEYRGAEAGLGTFHKYDYGHELLSLTQVAPSGRRSQFYLTDALASTTNLTDTGGTLAQSYRYDAWGRQRDQAGASDNPRQFTSQYRDAETGLQYFGARYYDEESGRFLSQDPLQGQPSMPSSLHRYLYAHANPVRFTDPLGLEAVEAPRKGSWWNRTVTRRLDERGHYTAGNVADLAEWNVTEHIPGLARGAHDRVRSMAAETVLTAADIGFAGLKWMLPADARQRVEASEMNRAMSQGGQFLQHGGTVPELVFESIKGTVMAPVEFARTISDPHARSEEMGARLVDMVASVQGIAEGGRALLGGIAGAAEGVAAIRRVGAAAIDSAATLARQIKIAAEMIQQQRVVKVMRYAAQYTDETFATLAERPRLAVGRDARLVVGEAVRPFTARDAWKVAGLCARAEVACGVSGGLTPPRLGNVWDNFLAKRSGAAWYDPALGKMRGDLDFHMDRPVPPFADAATAQMIDIQMSARTFDLAEDHGVLTFKMTPQVMGAELGAQGDKLMSIIKHRAPEMITKDGYVRADLYLSRGVYFTAKDLEELGAANAKPGKRMFIFKHGDTPYVREPQPFYVY